MSYSVFQKVQALNFRPLPMVVITVLAVTIISSLIPKASATYFSGPHQHGSHHHHPHHIIAPPHSPVYQQSKKAPPPLVHHQQPIIVPAVIPFIGHGKKGSGYGGKKHYYTESTSSTTDSSSSSTTETPRIRIIVIKALSAGPHKHSYGGKHGGIGDNVILVKEGKGGKGLSYLPQPKHQQNLGLGFQKGQDPYMVAAQNGAIPLQRLFEKAQDMRASAPQGRSDPGLGFPDQRRAGTQRPTISNSGGLGYDGSLDQAPRTNAVARGTGGGQRTNGIRTNSVSGTGNTNVVRRPDTRGSTPIIPLPFQPLPSSSDQAGPMFFPKSKSGLKGYIVNNLADMADHSIKGDSGLLLERPDITAFLRMGQ